MLAPRSVQPTCNSGSVIGRSGQRHVALVRVRSRPHERAELVGDGPVSLLGGVLVPDRDGGRRMTEPLHRLPDRRPPPPPGAPEPRRSWKCSPLIRARRGGGPGGAEPVTAKRMAFRVGEHEVITGRAGVVGEVLLDDRYQFSRH